MSFNKITTSDLTNKGVSGLPDTPGLSTSEMQRKFDEIGKEVIVPKFNELVDELNKNGNVIKASDIVGIRVNANKQIEVTTDFNTWYATASSGHVVIDKNGNTLPQRGTMKFVGESLVYDDPENEQTVITAIQGAQGEEGPIGPVGPKGDRGQVYIPSIDEQGNISWTPADYTVPPAVRNIRGPQGVQGVQGPRGERGYNGKDGRSFSVLGQYESLEALQIAHPVGNEGDAYSVQLAEGNTIYLWDVDKREWVDIGSLQGPQGPQGEQGIQGIQGPPGIQGERGIPTSVNGLIGESIEVTPAVIPYTESKSLADLLGTNDISKYSDGTVTGAIKSACDKADANEAAIADVNSNLSKVGVPDYAHARLLDNTLSNITFEFTAPSNGFVTACGYGENQSTSYIQFIYNQNQNIRKAVQGVSDESISAQMTLSKGDTITINTCLSKRNSGTYFVPYKE